MVDLASLRGFVPSLANFPTLVYCHENQFAYPDNPDQPGRNQFNNLDAVMVSLYTALCADRLVFNSAYNRQTFLTGVSRLLRTLPDYVPPGIDERLAGSSVMPVPVGLDLQVAGNSVQIWSPKAASEAGQSVRDAQSGLSPGPNAKIARSRSARHGRREYRDPQTAHGI